MTSHVVVAIVSGGMDSSTLLYHLLDEGAEVECLSFDYGQRHIVELECARKVIGRLRLPHHIATLPRLPSSSALTNLSTNVPHGHYEHESMKATVVPLRNPLILTTAFAYAVGVGVSVVAYAAHRGDHAIYPDCRVEFIQSFRAMIELAWEGMPGYPLQLLAPFADWTKAQIARRGENLGVPWEDTWSCYEGDLLRGHCGKCGTCVERREAFDLAGVLDRTRYAS